MVQREYVYDAMKKNGGYATLQQLYKIVDTSTWKTKTPFASIRRIVQLDEAFIKIKPGLWALKGHEEEVWEKLGVLNNDVNSMKLFTHSYYQGIVTQIGNMHGYKTFIPAQDKNKFFLQTRLSDIATITRMEDDYQFSYTKMVNKAKTVDVVWFNERRMPCAFFEIEHTTDIKNSLNKFYELQDFHAKFSIVADKKREEQFRDIISNSIYRPIKDFVKFIRYDDLVKQYEGESNLNKVI